MISNSTSLLPISQITSGRNSRERFSETFATYRKLSTPHSSVLVAEEFSGPADPVTSRDDSSSSALSPLLAK